ncbi:MAG TPA: Mur ligase family protein [Pyrinomonadaceae bacterium]
MAKRRAERRPGQLVVIGGAEDREEGCEVLREFVRLAGGKIVEMLFPEGDGRVPLISVTGTNGKTTVARTTGHVLASTGLAVGVTTTDGIRVGGRRVTEGDTTGPHSARTVLSDPTVEAAVLETARGFQRIVVKEDKDLRGRRPGEVADIIRRVVNDEAPWLECSVVLCEEEALRRELGRLGPEEIVVTFYDKLDPLGRILAEFGAEPVETIEGLAPREEARAAAAGEHAAPSDAASAPLAGVRRVGRDVGHSPAQEWQGYTWR